MPIESVKSARKIISLDFDGVLHRYAAPCRNITDIPDDAVDGAMDFLRVAMQHFEVHIHSARSRTMAGRTAMYNWLVRRYGDHFHLSYDDARNELRPIGFPACKSHAHLSIDDRAIKFCGVWPTVEFIEQFKPYNR